MAQKLCLLPLASRLAVRTHCYAHECTRAPSVKHVDVAAGINICVYGTVAPTPSGDVPTSISFTVDNGMPDMVNSPTMSAPQNQFLYYSSPGLTDGKHTLDVSIANMGAATFWFDYLQYELGMDEILGGTTTGEASSPNNLATSSLAAESQASSTLSNVPSSSTSTVGGALTLSSLASTSLSTSSGLVATSNLQSSSDPLAGQTVVSLTVPSLPTGFPTITNYQSGDSAYSGSVIASTLLFLGTSWTTETSPTAAPRSHPDGLGTTVPAVATPIAVITILIFFGFCFQRKRRRARRHAAKAQIKDEMEDKVDNAKVVDDADSRS